MVIDEIIAKIKEYKTIIIHRHVRPDPDSYGSQGGLGEMITASFPEKHVYMVGEEEETLNFLNRMCQIEDRLFEGALVIICDTANHERISDERYKLADYVIKIDHHPNVDSYGDLEWVDPSFSSTSEMIYELYANGKDKGLVMNAKAAQLIYAGIVGDTGRFLYPSTSSRTFAIASELIKYDFKIDHLYNDFYQTSEVVMRLNGYIFSSFSMTKKGMAFVKITKEVLREYGATSIDASNTSNALGELTGIKSWAIFIEEDDRIRVRLRSKELVINQLAAKYHGGGHPLASGATVYSWEEADQLLTDLQNICFQANK